MTVTRRLWELTGTSGRRRLLTLAGMTAAGSAFEAVGIGLILPYLNIVTRPSRFFQHELGAKFLAWSGITTSQELMIVVSVLLALVFVLKNLFIGMQWRAVYGFLYDRSVDLSRRLLEGYLRVPYTFHLQRNTAELVRNTTTEARRVYDGAVRSALELFAEAVVAAGLVAVLFITNTVAAAVVLGVFLFFGVLLVLAYRNRLRRVGSTRAEHQSTVIQAVNEGMGALKEVKILGREPFFAESFTRSAGALADALREEAVVRKYPRLVLETGAVVVMIGLAGAVVFSGTTMLDAVPVAGVFGVATVRLMPSMNRIVDNANQLRYQAAAVEIVHRELIELEGWRRPVDPGREAARRALPFEDRLEVEDLAYRYNDGSQPALRGVSFTVRKGDTIGIVGPSGSGKTTLVDLLLGLLDPTDGRILVDGTDIREDPESWQRQIGYIPQDVYLTDASVARNVAFGIFDEEIDEERVWEALRLAQLGGFVRSLERGVETKVGENGVQLSGGQRQRVAIARALYHDPAVLVLDEATSSLDYETERGVMAAVEELTGDRTLIVVTHRLRTVRNCDALHLLEDGELIAAGGYEELIERSARFQQLALEG